MLFSRDDPLLAGSVSQRPTAEAVKDRPRRPVNYLNYMLVYILYCWCNCMVYYHSWRRFWRHQRDFSTVSGFLWVRNYESVVVTIFRNGVEFGFTLLFASAIWFFDAFGLHAEGSYRAQINSWRSIFQDGWHKSEIYSYLTARGPATEWSLHGHYTQRFKRSTASVALSLELDSSDCNTYRLQFVSVHLSELIASRSLVYPQFCQSGQADRDRGSLELCCSH
jgi:hypothetical protein